MAALHGPERIIVWLNSPVQSWAVEELGWVMMTQQDSRSEGSALGQEDQFSQRRLSGRSWFRRQTFAETRRNGRDAP
jgi:hypothetical protein